MNRRTFLQQLAATPIVFGLAGLLAQDDKKSADWYRAALKRMNETGRCGIVLVTPAGEAGRLEMGRALLARLEADNAASRELFCEAVWICTIPALAPEAKGNRLLLDPDGKRVAEDTVSIETLQDPEKFIASFATLLHGEGDVRLKERAAAIEKTLGDEVKRALENLDAEDIDTRDAAASRLLKDADTILPWLVQARLKAPSDERRGQIAGVIKRYFEGFDSAKPGPRLPYGARMPKFTSSCGRLVEDTGQGVPECGMARVPDEGRRFIKFLAT